MPLDPAVDLKVRIEPDLPAIVPDSVSFETGATRDQAADPDLYVYEHHGKGFGVADPGALTAFFEDLILGRALPLSFATTGIHDVDVLVAIALFLQRDLAIHPAMPGFIAAVDLVHRRGLPALAHIDADLARFLCILRAYFPEKGLTKREFGDRLATSVGWVRDYVMDGRLPHAGAPLTPIRVIQAGTNGFILGETSGSLIDGWVEAYRQGYLRGLLVSPDVDGRRFMLGSRKSAYIAFDLPMAARLLNQMEGAMGELPEWKSDGLWLESPTDGTLILTSHIIEVLVRV